MLLNLSSGRKTLQQHDVMIIIGGDSIDFYKTSGLPQMLSAELGLQDVWDYQDAPETHRRGSQCIYQSQVFHKVANFVKTREYLEFQLCLVLIG